MAYDPYFNKNDNYGVKRLWGELKLEMMEIMEGVDQELLDFYKPTHTYTAGKRARDKVKKLRKMDIRLKEIKDLIMMQDQDYRSDYSDK
jgi:hypothetical protein